MEEYVKLHPDTIEALASAIANKFGAAERAVLTSREAMTLVGKKSLTAFYRWLDQRGVKSCRQGRYNRAALERALADEAGISYRRHQITNTARRKFEIRPLV